MAENQICRIAFGPLKSPYKSYTKKARLLLSNTTNELRDSGAVYTKLVSYIPADLIEDIEDCKTAPEILDKLDSLETDNLSVTEVLARKRQIGRKPSLFHK